MAWIPRSGNDRIENVVWLPRLLEKARRSALYGGDRCFEGYCYGDNDFVDAIVLRFLDTNDGEVSRLVREHSDDAAVARELIARSGKTPQECVQFSDALARRMFGFALMEADEGRMPPGLRRSALRFCYNGIMMPAVYRIFNRKERARGK